MSIAFFTGSRLATIPYGSGLTIVLASKSLQEFKEILARGLNTAPPEKYPDWIALSDQLRDQEESEAFTPSP